MPPLLNIVRKTSINTPPSVLQPSTSVSGSEVTSANQPIIASTQTNVVHPVLISENQLPSFVPSRNSSSILKEILHDA